MDLRQITDAFQMPIWRQVDFASETSEEKCLFYAGKRQEMDILDTSQSSM